jgi:hypothetical protein
MDILGFLEGIQLSPAMITEEMREDVRSLMESAPWVVRLDEGAPPIRCECCGTWVMKVPEGAAKDGLDRVWKPAIWEAEAGRKHTLRRCEWKRSS